MAESALFDDRAPSYLRSGDVAASIASDHFGIAIDDLTRRRWQQLMGLLREVDTMADDTAATHPEVLDSIASFTAFEGRYPQLSPAALGPDVQAVMLRRTGHILKLGVLASQTDSVRRYAALRALEGRQSVLLFGDCASPEVTTQPALAERFLPSLGNLAAAATLWDSLVDGGTDFKSGKQRIRPNPAYYKAVAGMMLHTARGNLRCLMHAGPMYYGGMKLVDRVVNRVKNGVPSYSNLYRFTWK